MKLLLDMNLAPSWVGFLQEEGLEAVHWSSVGDPTAGDATIMAWARRGGYVIFTHDLDYSAILAAAEALGPSVIQIRAQDVLPDAIGSDVVRGPENARYGTGTGRHHQSRQGPVTCSSFAHPAIVSWAD